MYECQNELDQKARELETFLIRRGFDVELEEDSFRDYTVKLSAIVAGAAVGKINLYYSPNKKSFTYRTHEIKDRSAARELDAVLQEFAGERAASKPDPGISIYVDGSYRRKSIGYAAVILNDGQVRKEISGAIEDGADHTARNVVGELRATEEALKWCTRNGIKQVTICYDYAGIEKWATGAWKTNQLLTQNYRAFVKACPVKIRWRKVRGHSGDRWNDRADVLAKAAIDAKHRNKKS